MAPKNQITNFIFVDTFCEDLSNLMDELNITDEKQINDLEDDWTRKVELTTLEPMFVLTADDLADQLNNTHDDRYSEDAPEHDKIIAALNACVDFEKLNSMIPKLCYPSNEFLLVTKNDLIEYCKKTP